jgi:hypothetical protein
MTEATPTALYGEIRDEDLCAACVPKRSKRGIATPKRDLELIRERLKWAERLRTDKVKEG